MQRIRNVFLRVKTRKIKVLESIGDEIKFIPVEILFSGNKKRFNKRIEKAKLILKNNNVTDIILTDEVRDIISERYAFGIPKGSLLTSFKLLYNKLAVKRCKMINVCDKELCFFSYQIAEQIIYMAERVSLYTINVHSAKAIADKIFYEYGVWIDIKEHSLKCYSSGFLIDADRGIIRIGDVCADNVIYDLNSINYNVDLRPLADNPDISDKIRIKNLVSGKNLIKIS